MQTEGRDASLRAIFAEVQLILCKSKTIRPSGKLSISVFYTALHKEPRKRLKINTKKRKKKRSKKNNQKKTIK